MNSDSTGNEQDDSSASVSKQELNSWKRGFTPQAEIWNGRMAIVGIVIGIFFYLFLNSSFLNH